MARRTSYPNNNGKANGKANGQTVYHNDNHIHDVGTLTTRANLAALLGTQFAGKRNLYDALGYDLYINYDDVAVQYERQEMAGAIINRPVNMTWQGDIELSEGDDEDETPLETEFVKLRDKLKLKSKFKRLDKLASLGKYGVLLLGFDDTRVKQDFQEPVSAGNRKLLYVKPYSQGSIEIKKWVEDTNNERFGLPELYDIKLSHPSSDAVQEITVHHSRVIHVTGELLESETEGISDLKRVWNRLKDLEKLLGGSAEMFWLGARPGYQLDVREDAQMSQPDYDNLQSQIQEYEHNLRRMLQTQGTDVNALSQQISDPSNHFEIQIQAISADTGIPKRILMGSERGELSSGQDRTEWLEKIQNRREEYAEDQIVVAFVDRMIQYGVLPQPGQEGYTVKWSDVFAPSEKDKAEVGKIRAEALKAYASQPAIQEVITPDQFVQHFLGLDPSVADKILTQLQQNEIDEQREGMEDEEIMEQNT